MNVLVTGASGFVGGGLAVRLECSGNINLTCAVRRSGVCSFSRQSVIGDLNGTTDWSDALYEQHVVVHAAARAHVMHEETVDPLSEYRRVNVDGTLNLARQAAAAGVSRFVFVSSIKVNGECTTLNEPFTADQKPAPEDAYGISKREAEDGLLALAAETGMEVVIIRPPLVYGPGVKGNFATMAQLVRKGIPLPLGLIHNKRTLVALDNLIDLIITCIEHPKAANQIFLVGDDNDLSTPELLRAIGKAVGKPARLVPVPKGLLLTGAGLLGKRAVAQRVLGSLRADISKTRHVLGWQPPVSVEEGLRRCFHSETLC